MAYLIEAVKKLVVLVLLMELVIRMQSGKKYEAYIKLLVGLMVVYSVVSGVVRIFSAESLQELKPLQDYVWEAYGIFENAEAEQRALQYERTEDATAATERGWQGDSEDMAAATERGWQGNSGDTTATVEGIRIGKIRIEEIAIEME